MTSGKKGESLAIKIQSKQTENIMVGRHFDAAAELLSRLSRHSINLLKENFRDELAREDWITVIKLKKLLSIE